VVADRTVFLFVLANTSDIVGAFHNHLELKFQF
jgi:hypothetical protein